MNNFENELNNLKSLIEVESDEEEENLKSWILMLGYNKCLEMRDNYISIIGEEQEKIPFKYLFTFSEYEYLLANVLFSLLRIQEDNVKAYLSNINIGKRISIESRPSNYSKTKYYFLFPVYRGDNNSRYLHIRTNCSKGPVDYYHAIRSLDFGDVNLLFSHLSNSQIAAFSNNPEMISDLDRTRKLRNYVYHHNLLYSLGISRLKQSIILLLKNIPSASLKHHFIDVINKLSYNESDNSYDDVAKKIAIHIDESDIKEIFSLTSLLK